VVAKTADVSIPLALYLHFPWCVSKCPYCDFNSFALRDVLPEQAYLDALENDLLHQLEQRASALQGRSFATIFMGGGTPSLFSPQAIARVIETVRRNYPLDASAEITLEANPATVERGRFAEYAAAGINRVSLGAQSFDPQALRALGRIHQPADVVRAAEELHAAGLHNFNLDLMYGLPATTPQHAIADVEQALALRPAQVSHYHLTLEPGTPFAAQPPADLPDDQQTTVMLEAALARFSAAGLRQYEVSAHATVGRECAHNLIYWGFGDYLGVGAGAHGKLSRLNPDTGELDILRSTHSREPRRYQRDPRASLSWLAVPAEQRPFEFLLNALRLTAGFELATFTARTGLAAEALEPRLSALIERGLLAWQAGRLVATDLGQRFLNEVLVEFLPAKP
jgi:putative oxygen-independent coproporphyrinogen III oxidase